MEGLQEFWVGKRWPDRSCAVVMMLKRLVRVHTSQRSGKKRRSLMKLTHKGCSDEELSCPENCRVKTAPPNTLSIDRRNTS